MRKLLMLTPENETFWQGGKDNLLNIHYCKYCSRYFHPPSPVCQSCRSLDVAPKPVSGRGHVHCDASTEIVSSRKEQAKGLRHPPIHIVAIGAALNSLNSQHSWD